MVITVETVVLCSTGSLESSSVSLGRTRTLFFGAGSLLQRNKETKDKVLSVLLTNKYLVIP
jgi:hypothetical protein